MSNLPLSKHNQPRNVSLDWISGILIIVIILVHTYFYYRPDWLNFIKNLALIFFMIMPWFFFKAGMFAKCISTGQPFKQSYKRLLVPWGIFGILSVPISFQHLMGHPSDYIEWIKSTVQSIFYEMAFPDNTPLWFLVALFVCHVLMNNNCSTLRIWPYILASFGFIAAMLLRLYNQLPWIHGMVYPTIFLGLFFYSCGYIFKEIQYTRTVLFISISVFVLLSFVESNVHEFGIDVHVNGNTSSLSTYILFYPRSLCAILIINYVASLLPDAYLGKSILTYIGRNSMGFYVIHWPLISLCRLILWHISPFSTSGNAIMLCLMLIVLLPVLDWLFRRYWPEALGLKRNNRPMSAPDTLP